MFIMSFLHVSSFDRNIPKVSQKTQYIQKKKIMCMERDTYSKFGKNIQHSTERKTMIYVVRLDWGG